MRLNKTVKEGIHSRTAQHIEKQTDEFGDGQEEGRMEKEVGENKRENMIEKKREINSLRIFCHEKILLL